jgi:RHS repeat-associated protein
MGSPDKESRRRDREPQFTAPSISLPKGGGAIRGLGEKFAANPVTGTGATSVPIAISPGRSGFGPRLSLAYDSGLGNGPFGMGWSLALPSITRKTDKGLPQYQDDQESDVFILAGSEDLVPALVKNGDAWVLEKLDRTVNGVDYAIQFYRPRIEGLFARIERWTRRSDGDIHWRTLSRENLTTLYGATVGSRIADPDDPTRIFSWLICQSHDDRGNVLVYEYKAENSSGVNLAQAHERNRSTQSRSAQRYLKRIRYGNRTPYFPNHSPGEPLTPLPGDSDWMFEVVFDYGEHNADIPEPRGDFSPWPVRHDPFSSYRAGFEVRTYRLCRRILMFHHFPDEPNVGTDCLVRSTDLSHSHDQSPADERTPIFSFLRSVTQTGYRKPAAGPGYLKRSLPPVEFTYTEAVIQPEIRELDPESLDNTPFGLDGTHYRWIDLDGEGLSGMLTEQAGAWFYKRNLSPLKRIGQGASARVEARFAAVELVATKPAFSLVTDDAQFLDITGDGQADLVTFHGPTAGFYERTPEPGWEPFSTFASLPNLDWNDPQLRFVDLTGDGHVDLLITEDEDLCWHPSLAEEGFGPRETIPRARSEELGPRLVFADGSQSIYLADMSGDGLTDLVRISNGQVCYWPNLGYGRFGTKVTMDNAPWFDRTDQFDQQRVLLADVDGSGLTDLIYLHGDGVRVYLNQSGNQWSRAHDVPAFPRIDRETAVTVVDLLGNGTACLVWSSPLPGDARRSLRYIDLMGGSKPHLLVKTVNNLGAETVVRYVSSTHFYLQDKFAGQPWVTKLPFPVHVVERVETIDHISRNRFVTRYAYHHGYFDGVEREFRGFGLVEQWDTEEFAALSAPGQTPAGTNLDASSHVPPVHTRTWFHTGVYMHRQHVSDFFAGLREGHRSGEYYREPGLSDAEARALLLPDTSLPGGLSVNEEREACRALKGAMLRQEVYGRDGTEQDQHPYTVTEQNFTVGVLQPRGENQHAVFLAHPREALSYHYERNPADPRVRHSLTLEADEFGTVLKSVAIGYGRRQPDPELPLDADRSKQAQLLITYTENNVTNPVREADAFRTPLAAEARTYEITGLGLPAGQSRFAFGNLLGIGPRADSLTYEEVPTSGVQKRLIEQVRTCYRRNDLTGRLPLGELQSLALPFESYRLALTPGLVAAVYGGRVDDVQLNTDGHYVHSEGDLNWWIPSGRMFFSADSSASPAEELARARRHFFLPQRSRDPFGEDITFQFDSYDLLVVETRDALGNRVTAGERDPAGNVTLVGNDYRVLQPWLMMDPNRNRTAVAFDALGLVVGTAVMGKPEEQRGDSLAGIVADLTDEVLLEQLADPLNDPQALLGRATSRLLYDVFAYHRTRSRPGPQPVVVYKLVRETHAAELSPGQQTRIQHSFSYSDGFGREIQKKIQAEPGPVPKRAADGTIVLGPGGLPELTDHDVTPRWVGSGWSVFNNKGQPVRKYEPFFTDSPGFEFDVRIGVSRVLFYDPAERVVATLHPDHTWEKVVCDPWRQSAWDVNDTVLVDDPRQDNDVGAFFSRLAESEYLPTWHAQRIDGGLGPREQSAARQAAGHAQTPSVSHTDALGRTFLSVVHNRFKYSDEPQADPPTEEFYGTRVVFDVEGNERQFIDAQGRVVVRYDYDMLGSRIHQASMEAGEHWTLSDVAGNVLYDWDSRGHRLRSVYDPLRRPTDTFLSEGAGPELRVGRRIYGESRPDPEARNLRGQVVEQFDQAGVVTSDEYEFKGGLIRGRRQLAQTYKSTLDWSTAVPLETETYTTLTRYDALNRPVELTAPDRSVIRPAYNEANRLERLDVQLRGGAASTPFVTDITYDAKGRRMSIDYGNGVRTTYRYDPLTSRLVRLVSRRNAAAFPDDCPQPPLADWPGCQIQDLSYTYDPAGNITHVRDFAQQTLYFQNRRVEPSAEYAYDAAYRLIEATGREHLGQVGAASLPGSYNDRPRIGILLSASDGSAVGRYRERYEYDSLGNFREMSHRGGSATDPGWTRSYAYLEPSQLEPTKANNRLTSTTIGATTETYSSAGDGYDSHGNMLHMPHLQSLRWNFQDQLQMTQRQAVNAEDEDGVRHHGERTWYVYDGEGQRVRKITESATGEVKEERRYIGGVEIYRRHGVNALVRETLHIMDNKQRIALVETRVEGDDDAPRTMTRYQLGNHLGSATLELDEDSKIISYEEYTPYGSTSYQAVRSRTETPKRYRYSGMERDEESGLNYHSARYYVPWLGRWASCDPIGIADGLNLFVYAHNSPAYWTDPTGTEGEEFTIPEDVRNEYRQKYGKNLPTTQKLIIPRKDRKKRTRSTGSDQGKTGGTGDKPKTEPKEKSSPETEGDEEQPETGPDPGTGTKPNTGKPPGTGTETRVGSETGSAGATGKTPGGGEGAGQGQGSGDGDENEKPKDGWFKIPSWLRKVLIAVIIITAVVSIAAFVRAVITGFRAAGAAGAASAAATTGATTAGSVGGAGGATALVNQTTEVAPALQTATQSGDTATTTVEAFTGTDRVVAGYDLNTSQRVIGDTYQIEIQGWYERVGESQGVVPLLNALKQEAVAAGASKIEIIGSMIENPVLQRMSPAAAARFGLTMERIDKTMFILRGPVK